MKLTAAAVLFSAVGAAGLSSSGQAAAEQDFHPIWCPQATTYYIQLREALDPLRAATVAHDLDIAKAKRQAGQPKPAKPAPNVNSNPDQPPYTEDGNPLRPRYSEPHSLPLPQPPADQPSDPASAAPAAPTGPAPAKQWAWGDPEVQDAVDQFEEKSPLLFRRINTLVAMTWWAELQDAGSALSEKFGQIIGDEREEVSAQDLTRDWISLEEQYDVVKNLCIGWGETAVPGVHPPGQPEWPEGSSPDTARPPGIENTAWPHTPGWVDVDVPDPDDPSAPPSPHRPFTPLAETNQTPLAPPGCERYDFRAGGMAQNGGCPNDRADEPEASDGSSDSEDSEE
ncbi:hypothetical protein [Segniliparus rugosus]|nr:hypothetical protein [Segniliparus rugosus]